MSVNDIKPWLPRTTYYKDESFIFKDVVYKVLQTFITGQLFDDNDSRYTVDTVQSGEQGRGISSVVIENGDLIITYSDGQVENVGSVGGGSSTTSIIESLAVTSTNTLAEMTYSIKENTKAKLFVNHLVYFNVGSSYFTISDKTVTWNPSIAGFNLEPTDSVVIEYWKT